MNKEDTPLNYKKVKQFFHCKSCIEQFLHSPLHEVMTPRDYGMYEVGLYELGKPGESRQIVTVWCKRCGQEVWDSRSLTIG